MSSLGASDPGRPRLPEAWVPTFRVGTSALCPSQIFFIPIWPRLDCASCLTISVPSSDAQGGMFDGGGRGPPMPCLDPIDPYLTLSLSLLHQLWCKLLVDSPCS
jgi:hypothetical protein